jgi:CRP/FNR family transcriptional regulator
VKRLHEISLFFNLDESIIEEIGRFSFFRKYKKGTIIFLEGEEREHFFAVVKGQVLLYDVDQKGEIIPRMEIGKGGIFGLIAKIQNRPFCLSAISQSEVEILGIDYRRFSKYLSIPPISDRIIRMLSYQIYQQMELSKISKLPALYRVAYTLLHFPDKFRRLKWYLIARELNMSRETLSRILSKLKHQGVISIQEREIKILQPDYLRQLIGEEV